MLEQHGEEAVSTFSFENFWGWLVQHPNCIVRAGTPDAVLVDDEDLHWHFAADGAMLVVQMIRGKRLMGELVVDPERVTYVQAFAEEEQGEFAFELVSEGESERLVAYFFVLSHGFEDGQPPATGRAVH